METLEQLTEKHFSKKSTMPKKNEQIRLFIFIQRKTPQHLNTLPKKFALIEVYSGFSIILPPYFDTMPTYRTTLPI